MYQPVAGRDTFSDNLRLTAGVALDVAISDGEDDPAHVWPDAGDPEPSGGACIDRLTKTNCSPGFMLATSEARSA
jgi:hypothetical protein